MMSPTGCPTMENHTMTEIIKYPNEILTEISVKVSPEEIGSESLLALIDTMKDILIKSRGVGLAACQIGVNKRVVLCKFDKEGIVVIINPIVMAKTENYWSRGERCLSVPGIMKDVKRSKMVKIQYIDERGNEHILKKERYESIIVQHELDHLKGKLIIDY